jgi:hypothetical protein
VVPVDAEFATFSEVPDGLLLIEILIGDPHQAKGMRIAILDACRDNAAERELKRQVVLAPTRNASGFIIAYATQYGAAAANNTGPTACGWLSWGNSSARHSPFTAALLNNIATPGVDVTDMFRKVGRDTSWIEHLRQHERVTSTDRPVQERCKGFS